MFSVCDWFYYVWLNESMKHLWIGDKIDDYGIRYYLKKECYLLNPTITLILGYICREPANSFMRRVWLWNRLFHKRARRLRNLMAGRDDRLQWYERLGWTSSSLNREHAALMLDGNEIRWTVELSDWNEMNGSDGLPTAWQHQSDARLRILLVSRHMFTAVSSHLRVAPTLGSIGFPNNMEGTNRGQCVIILKESSRIHAPTLSTHLC